ncbi:ribonuclease P protein subunit p40 isoform X2 [Motacilla alba alba]|uniref:ribonuclease P protein subunit p40 isoform X2 n=1 Tax=Motacilla alba alba TaxID=1094192 RepID=UPI0018D5513B|nr:ribonuclease P protein subunit p40 isoform X2 [Motacilla alba alba]
MHTQPLRGRCPIRAGAAQSPQGPRAPSEHRRQRRGRPPRPRRRHSGSGCAAGAGGRDLTARPLPGPPLCFWQLPIGGRGGGGGRRAGSGMLPAQLGRAPRHLLVCERGHARHPRSRHAAHVRDHAYSCRVSFLIPECGVLPEVLKSTIADIGEYYLVRNLPIHELVAHEFIDAFVKKGKLILSVDKDTYEELGLQGRPSRYSGKKVMRYIITIDLTDAGFYPESKKHNRVLWALKEKKPLEFDFLLAWYNTGAEGSTLMSYFSKNQIQALKPKITFSTLRDLQCPVLQSNDLQGKPEESCSTEELFEWLGAVLNQVSLDNKSSSFLSTYCCPEPNTVVEKAFLCTITGFIIPEKIIQLLEQLCCYFGDPKLAYWLTLTVHGFADSPVSWRESEHGFHKGGENLYNFVIFRNLDYWLQMAVGAHDDCPP